MSLDFLNVFLLQDGFAAVHANFHNALNVIVFILQKTSLLLVNHKNAGTVPVTSFRSYFFSDTDNGINTLMYTVLLIVSKRPIATKTTLLLHRVSDCIALKAYGIHRLQNRATEKIVLNRNDIHCLEFFLVVDFFFDIIIHPERSFENFARCSLVHPDIEDFTLVRLFHVLQKRMLVQRHIMFALIHNTAAPFFIAALRKMSLQHIQL